MRVAIVALALLLAAPAAARADQSPYAPLDRPGPPLSVPAARLAAALACTPGVAHASRNPILLVPGTNLDPGPNFSWNYERAFSALHWPYCTLTLPFHSMGDIQVAAEYVVYALRTVAREAGRRVDVVGFSQGGMVPRWALRFWPDTRALVGDLVGLDPSNHGTADSQYACRGPCPPAYWQQASGARFVAALNSRAETFAGVDYTVAFSRDDEVVFPNFDTSGSSSLHTGSGRIANVLVQQICPGDSSEHLAMGSYDPVGYALVVDALTHAGPADPRRVPASTCSEAFQPGVNPATFPADYAGYLGAIFNAAASSPEVPAEPALKCYVFAACPAGRGQQAAPRRRPAHRRRHRRRRHRSRRRHAHRRHAARFTG